MKASFLVFAFIVHAFYNLYAGKGVNMLKYVVRLFP